MHVCCKKYMKVLSAEPSAQKKHALLISKQTDSHMLYCFAGGVSTLVCQVLSEAEQLCILAAVASHTGSRRYAQARNYNAWAKSTKVLNLGAVGRGTMPSRLVYNYMSCGMRRRGRTYACVSS